MIDDSLEFRQCKYALNPLALPQPDWSGPEFRFLEADDMLSFHRGIKNYAPTPVVSAPGIAREVGVGMVFVKDESRRFHLKAFKALGASYAIFRFLKEKYLERFNEELDPAGFWNPEIQGKLGTFTFCAATDGNHGRAVAWTARMLGHKAVIYMPADTAPARIESIRGENAEAVLVPGAFDDCVRRCAEDAIKYRRQAISDTAYPGYADIPRFIMLGYTTLFLEMEETLHPAGKAEIDFTFLPAGVGGLAAAGASFYVRRYGARRPILIAVEPSDCDCFLESVRFGEGRPLPTRGSYHSIMAGLNCGVPSPAAWPIIRDAIPAFVAITDDYAEAAMRMYRSENITSGESGAAGLAALLALHRNPRLNSLRDAIGMNENSRVLLINTEGDTDPIRYRDITENHLPDNLT